MATELFSNFRNGKVVFNLRGFYFAQPNFDWRPKLVQLFDNIVGYYFDSEKTDATLGYPDDANVIYDIIIASPTEDSLYVLEDVMEHLKICPTNTVFTYLNEYSGSTYDENQITYLNKVGAMVNESGGIFFTTKSLDMLAGCINMLAYQKIKELPADFVYAEEPIETNPIARLNKVKINQEVEKDCWTGTNTEAISSEQCPMPNQPLEEEK